MNKRLTTILSHGHGELSFHRELLWKLLHAFRNCLFPYEQIRLTVNGKNIPFQNYKQTPK